MKCPNCQGEWTSPTNISLNKCPFCQTDLMQVLIAQSKVIAPELALRNLLQIQGLELLQNPQCLSAIIADLFEHDKRTKNLLLRSVEENIPLQIARLAERDQSCLQLQPMLHYLQEEAFINEEAARQMISCWLTALNLEEPDDLFEIVWERGFCGFRSVKGSMITDFKYDDAESFSEGLAKVYLNGKCGFIDKTGYEIVPPIYDYADSFKGGLTKIKLNRKQSLIVMAHIPRFCLAASMGLRKLKKYNFHLNYFNHSI